MSSKVRGFTLNTGAQSLLNFDLLKANVIDEVTTSLDEPRVIPVHNPHKIKRYADNKTLETVEQTKRSERSSTSAWSIQSHTQAEFEDVDMENINMLLEL